MSNIVDLDIHTYSQEVSAALNDYLSKIRKRNKIIGSKHSLDDNKQDIEPNIKKRRLNSDDGTMNMNSNNNTNNKNEFEVNLIL